MPSSDGSQDARWVLNAILRTLAGVGGFVIAATFVLAFIFIVAAFFVYPTLLPVALVMLF